MKASVTIGDRPHYVTVHNPGAPIPDGEGGFTESWVALTPPDWWVKIAPATARDLERVSSGAVLSTASHVVTGPHHPGVTTKTRITFGARAFFVEGVANPEERNIETIALAVEQVA